MRNANSITGFGAVLIVIKMSSEEYLEGLMKMLLEEKEYDMMEKTLEKVKDTFSRYDFYKDELKAYRTLDDLNRLYNGLGEEDGRTDNDG